MTGKDNSTRRDRDGATLDETGTRDVPPQPGSDDRPQPDTSASLGHHPRRKSPEEA